MRLLDTLLPAIAGLVALFTLASAKPIVTAVESLSARDLEMVGSPHPVKEQVCCTPGCKWCVSNSCKNVGCSLLIPWTSCCSLEVLRKRDEDGVAEAYNQQGELVTWVNAEEISERGVEMVGPPVGAQRLCCTSDCETCFESCKPIGCPVFPWTTCCVHPIFEKRDDTTQTDNQNGQLAESVDAGQMTSREVEMVGPPHPVEEEHCCTPGCGSCLSKSCRFIGCQMPWPWINCCALQVWPRKQDGTKQAYNMRGELVKFVDTIEPISSRDVDWSGPPHPVREQYCCTIGCGQCSSQECPDGECAPWMRCCALMVWEGPRKRDERAEEDTLQAYNEKGELVQFFDFLMPSSVEGDEKTKLG